MYQVVVVMMKMMMRMMGLISQQEPCMINV